MPTYNTYIEMIIDQEDKKRGKRILIVLFLLNVWINENSLFLFNLGPQGEGLHHCPCVPGSCKWLNHVVKLLLCIAMLNRVWIFITNQLSAVNQEFQGLSLNKECFNFRLSESKIAIYSKNKPIDFLNYFFQASRVTNWVWKSIPEVSAVKE